MKIKVYKGLDIIFSVQFKKIEIIIDYNSYVFLGNIKSDKIEISKRIKSILLRKFKIFKWYSYSKNLAHIKFLVKYSPIFSKFIDDKELDKIELEELQIISYSLYYLKFNENTKFLNAGFMMRSPNVISICIDSELMKMLEEENGVESIWMIKIEDL